MAGRPPTPSAILELRGSYKQNPQRRRLAEPEFESAAVPCPDYLAGEAKIEWDRVHPLLLGAGVMTPAYLAALAGYCHWYGIWINAARELNRFGSLVKIDGETVKSPYFEIARRASAEYRAWAIELGMTAVSKTRAASSGKQQKENRFAKFSPEVRPN
jgi:P27 family predicted phage terminase small subunit